ncbi:hypothetical protein Tco_0497073 [Tanacetum coccineum]
MDHNQAPTFPYLVFTEFEFRDWAVTFKDIVTAVLFLGRVLLPLSPSLYRENVSGPFSDHVVGDVSLTPRKTHRRSNSDIPFGFSTILQSSPPLILLRGACVKWESSNVEGMREIKCQGEVVDDMFNAYLNLNNLGRLNTFIAENGEHLDSRASGTKANEGDSSNNKATSSVIGSGTNNMQRSGVCSVSDKREGIKRSAGGDIAPTTGHYRRVYIDSVMGKMDFMEESLKLPPSPGGQMGKIVSSDSVDPNDFGLSPVSCSFQRKEDALYHGTGKHSQILAGLLSPTDGFIYVRTPRSFVFQNPDHQPPKVKAFIEKVIQCPLQDLTIPLSGFSGSTRREFSSSEAIVSVVVILRQSDITSCYYSPIGMNGTRVWDRKKDLLIADTLEDDTPFPKQSVLQILRVMQIILRIVTTKVPLTVIFTNESNIERWKNKRPVAVDSKIGRLDNFIKLVEVPVQIPDDRPTESILTDFRRKSPTEFRHVIFVATSDRIPANIKYRP